MITRLKELLFQNRSVKQTIAKNFFWLSVSQIGSRLIRAIILIYAARALGASEYGIFSYVLGIAGFFTIFADLGLSSLLTRETANHKEQQKTYFASALFVKIILLAITALLIIFVAPKFSRIGAANVLIPFVAILVFFDNIRDFIFAHFRGIEKMEMEGLLTTLMNVSIAVAGFIILYFSKTSGALLASYIISDAVLSLVAFFYIKNLLANIWKNFNKKIALEFFHNSWPLAFAGLFGIFMLNIDMVFLGWWRSAAEIGYYAASQRVIQILYTLPAILASAAFPAISRLIKNKEVDRTRQLNEKTITILYAIAMPLAIGGIVLGAPIIQFLFGKEYLPGVPTFQILSAALLINFPGAIISNLILAHNQQKKLFKYLALGALTNVIFDVLLIPPYGITGSAVATFLSQFAYFAPIWLKMKNIENFQTFHHLKKISIAAIIMGIFNYILNRFGMPVLLNIILTAALYPIILYLLKEKTINEVKELFFRI